MESLVVISALGLFGLSAFFLLFSLSPLEILLLPTFALACEMGRRFNLFDCISDLITPNQTFSAHPELIYKASIVTKPRTFRLLRLLPGKPGSKLKCQLVTGSLDRPLEYVAISYVWGVVTKREEIECNGLNAYITINLARALHRMRDLRMPVTCWADGICINQEDMNEKGHQVQRMGEIFQKAKKVVAWLGPDDSGSAKKALKAIRFVTNKVPHPGHGSDARVNPGDPTLDNLADMLLEKEDIKDAWKHIDAFFARDWWQRIWCTQEVIVAKEVQIYCGDEEISGRTVGVYARWHHAQRWLGQSTPKELDEIGVRSAYRRLNTWGWTGTFLEILSTFKGLEATDPRDKVYALLGLLEINRQANIDKLYMSVDYHKTLQEVLYDAVACAARSEGSLHFLSYIDHQSSITESFDMPSWIPRWDEKRESAPDHLWCANSTLSAWPLPTTLDITTWKYSSTLKLKGMILDTISSITEQCHVGRSSTLR